MTSTLLLGTRKGLVTLTREHRGWRQARVDFLGDPVTQVLRDPRDDALYAALRLGHFGPKLRRSRDNGATWEEIPCPAFAAADPSVEPDAKASPSVDMIWALETGGDAAGTLWAGTLPGALFQSTDGGDSWQLNQPLWDLPARAEWLGGGYDDPGIHSICVDPRDSRRLFVAISSGGVWLSEDGGEQWSARTDGMRAAYMPPERAFDPNIQDPHRLVACRAAPDTLWVQHHNGIFRSDNGGLRWQELTEVAPSTFGFAVAVHPDDPATAWFVPAIKDERRVPVDGRLVVTRTRDGGKSFKTLSKGLPEKDCFDLIYRHGLAVDTAGQCLAMASTTGNLWFSADQGDSWELVSAHLPPVYCLRFD